MAASEIRVLVGRGTFWRLEGSRVFCGTSDLFDRLIRSLGRLSRVLQTLIPWRKKERDRRRGWP